MKLNKRVIRIVVLLIVAAVGWFTKESRSGKNGGELPLPSKQIQGVEFTPVSTSVAKGWEVLENCQLIQGRNNDGDSFHVRHGKAESEFRLYFVDTPESQFKTYSGGEDNGQRLQEQGQYFGELSQEETTMVGRTAKEFVKKILAGKSFTILTKWENVYGPDRKYAFVIVKWEGEDVYLHELLIAQGLGRIHTRGADLPQGRSWKEQKSFLKENEKKAQEAKAGAWSLSC